MQNPGQSNVPIEVGFEEPKPKIHADNRDHPDEQPSRIANRWADEVPDDQERGNIQDKVRHTGVDEMP